MITSWEGSSIFVSTCCLGPVEEEWVRGWRGDVCGPGADDEGLMAGLLAGRGPGPRLHMSQHWSLHCTTSTFTGHFFSPLHYRVSQQWSLPGQGTAAWPGAPYCTPRPTAVHLTYG